MRKYKVIWFDDEFSSLDILREKAYLNNIDLVGFNNAKAGIEELERNIKHYDAAIIDGLFYLNEERSGTPSSDKALFNVAMKLHELASVKKLPWFILSGQISFTKDRNRYADGLKENQVYDKLNEEHLAKLWKDIKGEADKQTETQLRHKYQSAFSVCDEACIGPEVAKPLLFLLESLEKEEDGNNTIDKLNSARKIIEQLFAAFYRIQILPEEVWKGNGGLNGAGKFLACKNYLYIYHEEIMPPTISFLLRNVLSITQDGSHSEGELSLKIDSFIKGQATGFLFKSVVFMLLEVLVWSKDYFEKHTDQEQNKNIATLDPEQSSIREGAIQKDIEGNYYCEDVLLSYTFIKNNNFKEGDQIKLLKIADNTHPRTMQIYTKFAVSFVKI
jgi:hypothetical protein